MDGELSDRKRLAVERHVQLCAPCTAAVSRLRGHKSALLGLQRPSLDPDFQRRLLSTTSRPPHAPEVPGSSDVTRSDDVRRTRPAGVAHDHALRAPRRRRAVVAATAVSAVVAAAVLGSAYVAGSPQQATAGAAGPTALRAGWESMVPRTPTALDADQLETLRAEGWACPALTSLGFTLRSAGGMSVGDMPTLRLVLEHDGDEVTVYEQRKIEGRPGATTAVPVNAASGRTVEQDGFDHVGGVGRDLWVRSGEPWFVVLDSPTVTYTVVSELPPAAMPQTLNQLVTTDYARLSTPHGQDGSMMDRIMRGLSVMTHPQDR